MKLIYLAIAILITLSACEKGVNFKNYPTYKDALEDGAIEKGWIPEFLPKSSTNIYENHDVDVNQIAVKFSSKDTTFLSKLKIIEKGMYEDALLLIRSTELPEAKKTKLYFYYLRCTQEGPGILATDGDGLFYYIEPAGMPFTSKCTSS
ncbi:hypothetical protein ACCQ12_11815 [Xanthomonas sp. NCPPB 1068]|uniref:hypothetical protein n=1 Tax=Xanthomonas sp. NCPPB 1068 TaxID=487525 RepID=UPI003556A661